MSRVQVACAVLCIFLVAGCGPLSAPMVPRLAENDQQEIDNSWERALTPPNQLGRQAMLDVLIVTQAFQCGVDRLTFRSEKQFSGGLVVMEVRFDKRQPEQDCFELTIYDLNAKVVRRERFERVEVENTNFELWAHCPPFDPDEAPEITARRQQVQGRWAVIKQFFPHVERTFPDAPKLP